MSPNDEGARGQNAERKMLGLMADAGLPAPDEIEHGDNKVRFLWTERKVAVVIDLTEEEA
jgi:hypothetical protein